MDDLRFVMPCFNLRQSTANRWIFRSLRYRFLWTVPVMKRYTAQTYVFGFSVSKKVWRKWRTEARIIHLNTSLPRCTYMKLRHREIQDYEHRR